MPDTNASWNPSRFFTTIAYFDAIPVFSWLQRLVQGPMTQSSLNESSGVVLVVGATGGVGRRVVQRLNQQGYAVRALVRNLERGREVLGAEVDLIDADITIPETLTSAVVNHVRAVVFCTGPRVQPVEGDTPDRAKYYQGIQFYLPEVVGDTPESVDYRGVQNLLEAIAPSLKAFPSTETSLFDFTTQQSSIAALWGALDDVVMGGVSQSGIRPVDQGALFTGNVSTANSGGFASVRTRNLDPTLNLAGYTGIKLRVKGDGKRYKFLLRDDDGWDSIAYSYSFDTVNDRWIDVEIPFADLIPVFRAKTLSNAAPIRAERVRSLQLMLSKFEYDGGLNPMFAPGPFALHIGSLWAYGGPTLPQVVLVSSAGVTRPGRPGLNLDEEPPAVRLNDQLGGILTWKLRGEEVVRSSGLPYTILRPCALTEESGGHLLTVSQGDTLRGKISREDAATLCVEVLKQPNACNRTIEISAKDELGPVDWATILSGLEPDRPTALTPSQPPSHP